MKKILMLFVLVLLVSCGRTKTVILQGVDGANGLDGTSCLLVNTILTCGDVVLDLTPVSGVDGKDGIDGKDGADGADGKDGLDGSDGKDGVDGKDGTAMLFSHVLTNSCKQITTTVFAKAVGTNTFLSTKNDCSNTVCKLNQNSDELCFVGSDLFIVDEGPSTVMLYVVIF
jgi:hypothetical protein